MPRLSSFFKYWQNQHEAFSHYWDLYGRWSALLRSPYVHLAIVLTAFCRIFAAPDINSAEIAISAIPNLLGFSVGAMAIVLALSSAPLFRTIAKQGDPASYFMILTSTLLHFILVQVVALLLGIVGKLTGIRLLDPLIVFLLFYAILVVLSAGVQLFQTSTIYNAAAGLPEKKPDA